MSSVEASRQGRVINELRTFIKKVLSDPTVAAKCMEIARQYKDDPKAQEKIASEISAKTIVRIPEQHSEADRIFLDIIDEVLDDEAALY
ncbi:MAG: hypothetical protein R3296_07050 [Oleiphilaceae bacterium]|nr:hypothetical protein [Oleiphilaceae bacterium]